MDDFFVTSSTFWLAGFGCYATWLLRGGFRPYAALQTRQLCMRVCTTNNTVGSRVEIRKLSRLVVAFVLHVWLCLSRQHLSKGDEAAASLQRTYSSISLVRSRFPDNTAGSTSKTPLLSAACIYFISKTPAPSGSTLPFLFPFPFYSCGLDRES